MSVKVNVYYFLPRLTNDREEIEVDGNTIGQCSEQLISLFTKVRGWLFGEYSKIYNFVNFYANLTMIDPDDFGRSIVGM